MSRNTLIQDYNRKHTLPTAVSDDIKQVISDFFLWKPLAITSTRNTSMHHCHSRTRTFPTTNISKSASSIPIKFTIPRLPVKEALLRIKKDKHEAPRTAELKFKLWLESDPEYWRAEKRKGEKEWHQLYTLVASHAGVTSVRGRGWLHTQHFSEQSQRSHQYFLWKPLAIAPTQNTFMQHSLSRTRTSPTAVFQEGHWAQLPKKITVPKLPYPR